MQKICSTLSHAGYDVELVGRERSFSKKLSDTPFKQKRLKCWINKGKLFYIEYNIRLFFYLLTKQFQALCAVDLDTIIPLSVLAKMKNAKLVYDAHEYFTEVPEVIHRKKVQQFWKWVEKKFVTKADLAYTVSPALAQLFSQNLQMPFHIILNTPVLLPQSLSKTRHTNLLIYQGALNQGRGLEQLILAMKHINAKLILVGEGDLSAPLRQLVSEHQLETKIEFTGFLAPDKLREKTKEAAIGVNLLDKQGLSYYYSLANKFFDYIHAGIPQISIDFPEYRKINQQFEVALLIKESSSNEIKTAVERLLTEDNLYTRLQKNCEVCSHELNWQQEEKKLIAMYYELFQ